MRLFKVQVFNGKNELINLDPEISQPWYEEIFFTDENGMQEIDDENGVPWLHYATPEGHQQTINMLEENDERHSITEVQV